MLFNTNINLLSKEKSRRLEQLIRFIFIRDILEIILLISAVLATVLLWSWVVLQEDFNNLAESSTLINWEYSKYNQEIRLVNNTIRELNRVSQFYLPITPKISDLIKTLPPDIKINALDLDRRQNKLIIAGVAITRNTLLDYQEDLKKINWLENIEAPTSQLFQKENINFEIKALLAGFPNSANQKQNIINSDN